MSALPAARAVTRPAMHAKCQQRLSTPFFAIPTGHFRRAAGKALFRRALSVADARVVTLPQQAIITLRAVASLSWPPRYRRTLYAYAFIDADDAMPLLRFQREDAYCQSPLMPPALPMIFTFSLFR